MERTALPVHHTEVEEGDWDGPANEARIPNDATESELVKAYAWVDPEGDPETKSAYKFVHHNVDSGGEIGAANMSALSAAVAVLNGGRGGADIPDEDREGVYAHVAAHYEDAGEEPPELERQTIPDEQIRTVQHRSFTVTDQEFFQKREDGQDKPVFSGYAAVFGTSADVGWFREIIEPGAFDRALEEKHDVRFLINHEGLPLARTGSGTLKLSADKKGLRVETELDPEDPDVQRIIPKMRRNDLDQMSFAFMPREWVEEQNDDQVTIRLKDVDLYDVSVVAFPAYTETEAELRARIKDLEARVATVQGDDAEDVDVQGHLDVLRRKLRLLKLK